MKEQSYIDRLKTKSVPKLKELATEVFNSWIRNRDSELPCISCGIWYNAINTQQAGHYLSGGHHSGIKYNEQNVNGQCKRCNTHLRGNQAHYREGLVRKYGEEAVKALEDKAAWFKRTGYKWQRFTLIETILKYKSK